MVKKILILTVSIFLLVGCNMIKTISILKSGEVQTDFKKDEIPFNYKAGLIIIEAAINGNNYNFIFDTGAPCAISTELASELGLKAQFTVNSTDSKGNKERTGFVEMENIQIGETNFSNIGAAIIDFNIIQEMDCFNIDGIIGANLMQKVKWQIDYKERRIVFASTLDELHVSNPSVFIEFTSSLTGTPLLDFSIADNVHFTDVKFDTGSNGGINLSLKDYNNVINKNKSYSIIKGYGASSSGVYGAGIDTSYYIKLETLKAGNLEFYNTIAEFNKNDDAIMGNDIFENYIVTIDWEFNKIYFNQYKQTKQCTLESFGFKMRINDHKLIVGFIFENSPASDIGLKVGDPIISIDNISYENISMDQYCDIVTDVVKWKSEQSISIKWKDSEGIKSSIINKIDIFPM